MRVLAVDDDPDILAIYQAVLPGVGYALTAVGSGEEAWRVQRESPAPILLVNWQLPGLSGVQLCRRIRQRAPAPYSYVLVVTARSQREDTLEALEAGADDFLSKPVDIPLLLARLRVAKRVLALEGRLTALGDLLRICMYCNKVRNKEDDSWQEIDRFLRKRTSTSISHDLCPTCHAEQRRAWRGRESGDAGSPEGGAEPPPSP